MLTPPASVSLAFRFLLLPFQVIDGDERPTCSRCKTKTRCEKTLSLEALPPILIVHIKRFEHTCVG